jgi:hypothetical protein
MIWDVEKWKRAVRVLGLVSLTIVLSGVEVQTASAVKPKVVEATRYGGVKKLANLRVDDPYNSDLGFRAVNRKLGKPGRVKSYYETCTTYYYGSGLTLLFTTFGGYHSCRDKLLQTATVWKRSWKVRVSGRTYRVGMPKRHTPRARFVRGFGYRVASMPAFGRRIGTVFLRFNSRNRVSSIYLWIGAAGD